MRPPLHASAPSQSALRYLRTLVFPQPPSYPACMAPNCVRLQSRFQRRFHAEALAERYGEGAVEEAAAVEAKLPQAFGLARANRREWWITYQKIMALAPKSGREPPRKWQLRCLDLIYRRVRLHEAMQMWLDAKDGGAAKEDVKYYGKTLMKAFNKHQQTKSTPQVFFYMVAHDPAMIDTACLNFVLEAYLKNNRSGKLLNVFKHYRGIVEPDIKTMDIILRNFIAMKRLDQAESLIRILLGRKGPVTPGSFATLLDGVKQTTGNLEEMRRIVEWMKTTTKQPHASIYNIMIKAALDFGRYDLAKEYAEEMAARGIQYNTDTFVLFLSKQSAAGDWTGVRRTMQRMQEHNLKLSTQGFNTLLNIHAHTTSDLSHAEIFFDSMLSHGIIPDRFSFNIMINACTRFNSEPSKSHWFTRMRSAGYPPDAVTFNTLFNSLRKTSPPYLLRRLYNAVADFDPNLVNAQTKLMLLNSMYKDAIQPYLPRRLPPSPPPENHPEVLQAMESALDNGRPTDAICIFSEHLSHGHKPSHGIVGAAIRTAFRFHPSEHDDLARLLYVANQRGAPVHEIAMFVISSGSSSAADYYNSTSSHRLAVMLEHLKTAYEFVGHAFLPMSHYVLVKAAWSLIDDGDAEAAVELVHRIANAKLGGEVKWDLVGLTVMLRAYTAMRDVNGVGWVVDQVLEGRIVPDPRFLRYLRRAKEAAETKEDELFLGWCVLRCLKKRDTIKDMEMDGDAKEVLKLLGVEKADGEEEVNRTKH